MQVNINAQIMVINSIHHNVKLIVVCDASCASHHHDMICDFAKHPRGLPYEQKFTFSTPFIFNYSIGVLHFQSSIFAFMITVLSVNVFYVFKRGNAKM